MPAWQIRWPAQGLDLGTRCIPMGMPRQMSGFYPFEFSFAPGVIHVLFEYSSYTTRRIYVDGRDWPRNAEPTFAGYSIGHWIDEDHDGRYDVLEVETRDLRGPRILDASGTPSHVDNESVIKERLYLDKADPDLLHDEMTMSAGGNMVAEPSRKLGKQPLQSSRHVGRGCPHYRRIRNHRGHA
jgi:hypothetical protein